jgi:type II secretory pathway component GspD/PulD (secretin)
MNTNTATNLTPELLSEIYDTLATASDTNTLVVRESVEFRQYAKELVKRLHETNEYRTAYANNDRNTILEANPVSDNIVAIWHTLHLVGCGDNSLSMKVRADKLANLIMNSPEYIFHQAELAEASI